MSNNLPRPSTPEATARAIAEQIVYDIGASWEQYAAVVDEDHRDHEAHNEALAAFVSKAIAAALAAADTRAATCPTHGDPLVCIACEQEEDARPEWHAPDGPRCPTHRTLKLPVQVDKVLFNLGVPSTPARRDVLRAAFAAIVTQTASPSPALTRGRATLQETLAMRLQERADMLWGAANTAPTTDEDHDSAEIAGLLLEAADTIEAQTQRLRGRAAREADTPEARNVDDLLVELGLTPDANLQSLQRRLHVNTSDAIRLFALREAIRASGTVGGE